jgi:nucleoside-diphosphate-sugar epimerase
MQGDVLDPAFMDRACEGAEVVYNTANPAQYHRWESLLPPLARAVREGAARAGARLVILDNLYMYGHTEDGFMREDTPMRPRNVMGELRKRLADEAFEAHARGELRVTSGRASDYYGPGTVNAAVFLPRTMERLAAGKAVEVIGNPDTRHSYSYLPDVARALAVLGTHPEADGRAWHLPTSWHGTTRELLQRFADHHGQELQVRHIPRWVLNAAGFVMPLMRAVASMNYQWDEDFILNDSNCRETFGFTPTPVDEAVKQTAASALAPAAAA